MILDATSISHWQACKRKYLLDEDYQYVLWRPKSLFDSCLRRAVVSISQGTHPPDAASAAVEQFMQSAANPGLDMPTGTNPYLASKEWCALLQTSLRAIASEGILKLHSLPDISLTPTKSWRTLAFADDSNRLHRWITSDSWDDADLIREMHSWWCIGDMAMTKSPMTLHVLKIGQVRKSRRASLWTRGWKHPKMFGNPMRFCHKDGSAMKGWTPFYLSDQSQPDYDSWVSQMQREGVAQNLLLTFNLNALSEDSCLEAHWQIMQESSAMQHTLDARSSWPDLPMSRNACDSDHIPCPFQEACYNRNKVIALENLGVYRKRKHATISGVLQVS